MIYVLELAVLLVTAIALPIILADNHCTARAEMQEGKTLFPLLPSRERDVVFPLETHTALLSYFPPFFKI